MKRITMVLMLTMLSIASFAQKDAKFLKGNIDFLKEASSIYVEFDMAKSSIDGLETEEEFIEYKMSKSKDAKKWEKAWKADKKNFTNYYTRALEKKFKKTGLTFNDDDPDSKYKMVYRPTHIDTGNPVKKSSIKGKLHFYDMATDKEIAVLYIPRVVGEQMGPMTPTVGARVNIVLYYSATIFYKFYKKSIK